MEKARKTSVVRPPTTASKQAGTARKVARALEVRESSSKARQGKPLAFPTHRMHP